MQIKEDCMERGVAPIVIGVTGHRNLRQEELPAIQELAEAFLLRLKKTWPDREIQMMNALAEGADTICAEIALNMGIPLICPLPLPVMEYEGDFLGEARVKFHHLLSQASSVFVSPHLELEEAGRDYLYRQAGLYLVSRSHILLAVWDGSAEKMDGCGTAAAVFYAQDRNRKNQGSPIGIYQIQVNRGGSQTQQDVCAGWLEQRKYV